MGDASGGFAERLATARAGSGNALGGLLESFRGYLLMVADRELGADLRAKGGASDLVQETFLEAHRDFITFRGVTEPELLAWLRCLLLNNLANFARRYREAEKRRVSREVPLGDGGSSASGLPEPPADTPTPSWAAVKAEDAEALLKALDRLPDDYRRVLTLRHQEGRSFAEIAESMGRTANAVHKLWARAIEQLQSELEAPP
jgi:RNA polymerase sigma-70 factor (ECF subfamily)